MCARSVCTGGRPKYPVTTLHQVSKKCQDAAGNGDKRLEGTDELAQGTAGAAQEEPESTGGYLDKNSPAAAAVCLLSPGPSDCE